MPIRPALRADVPALYDLAQRAYERYIERIGQRPWPMDVDYAKAVDDHDVFVFDDRRAIGFIVLVPETDHLLVDNIAVDPGRQGEGIGLALLAHAEQRAAEAGLGSLRLYTNAAMTENLAFYARRGYDEVERRRENGFERVFFVKTLG